MKLVRLTTTTEDGKFDNIFDDEIILEPNSKIALQSVSINTDITDITIDAANEEVEFEITSGNTRTITLDHGDYDEHNGSTFLNQLQLKLNQGIRYTDGQSTTQFRDELGVQFAAGVGSNDKVQISVANCKYTYTAADLSLSFKELVDGQLHSVTANGALELSSAAVSGTGNATETHGISSIFPFTTGCGVMRIKLSAWTDDSSGATSATSGFEFGLCDSTADTWTLPNMPSTKKTYAIRGFQPGTNYYQKTSNSSDFVDSTYAPETLTGGNADVLEISIQGKNIVGKVFRESDATAQPLFTTPYEVDSAGVPKPLYGYLVVHGTRANIKLAALKFTSDPFLQPSLTNHDEHEDLTIIGTGATPLTPRNQRAVRKIDFKSINVANYLGFDNTEHITITTAFAIGTFVADHLFFAHVENECFLILLDNLPLKSFDGFKNGRKSILASVPNSQNSSRVIYEPNNLNYIELNNANTISLRNIRARILYQDYSPVKTKGFSVLNVLVD